MILSPIILKDVLPPLHYHCWSLFVEACYLLCSRTISLNSLDKADDLLLEFCTTFVNLYGYKHMHCHLKDSVIDYGPVYSFWLFSFERFNCLLGSIPTNSEPPLRKRFVCDQQLHSNELISELQASNTQAILSNYRVAKGSVAQQTNSDHSYSLNKFAVFCLWTNC